MASTVLSLRKKIPILLLGCGGVGQQLLSHILDTRPLHAAQGTHISVKGVCDSKFLVMAQTDHMEELNDTVIKTILSMKSSKHSLSSLDCSGITIDGVGGDKKTEKLLSHFQYWKNSSGLVVVDCTASEETAYLLSKASEMGLCVVLANKKPLTTTLDTYHMLSKHLRRLRCESTVGAGLPIITTLARFLAAGDTVHQIVGALSGTLGYVMSELQEGGSFSSIVQAAKSLGYTEPDPRDDLSGIDVARKALIMARLLGWKLHMEDVEVESLFPKQMDSNQMPLEQFLNEGLKLLDRDISERVCSARSRGCVLRYVATIHEGRCKVGIAEVQVSSPLGQLKGSDNLIEIYSRCYKKSPFVMQGAGAGNDTTACGVLADIVDLQDLF